MWTLLGLCMISVIMMTDCVEQPKYCTMIPDQGQCEAYSRKYYYDPITQNCKIFVYGGCLGNKNRFSTIKKCLEVCSSYDPDSSQDSTKLGGNHMLSNISAVSTNPEKTVTKLNDYSCQGNKLTELINTVRAIIGLEPLTRRSNCENRNRDVCLLLPETGPCRAMISKFYYNGITKTCTSFAYGGCFGNDNRFDTQKECQDRCKDTSRNVASDICLLPKETGPCKAFIPTYFYNATSRLCEEFVYGGCLGNDNRFDTQKECQDRCKDTSRNVASDICLLPKETGPCKAFIPTYFYNATSRLCEEFVYGGCLGNDNRFDTQKKCQDRCKDTSRNVASDICLLPKETGPCKAFIMTYFYNATSRLCEEFVYGGCLGNDNRFDTQKECQDRCKDTSRNVASDICLLPKETGPCKAFIMTYFYNATSRLCEEFVYGGCLGNDNRFDTQKECQDRCKDTSRNVASDICLLPKETGPCKAFIPTYFYNATSRLCEEFVYGGCLGNDNRFDTQKECQDRCKDTSRNVASDICLLPKETGPCKAFIPTYFYNATSRLCEAFVYGGCLGNDNRFDTQKECQDRCNEITHPIVSKSTCHLAPDVGPCKSYMPSFFYNLTSRMCETFTYGGCHGNNNRFENEQECQDLCKDTSLPSVYQNICLLPQEPGPCEAYMPSYFYNSTSRMCEAFIYGGCHGNDNRFDTDIQCREQCQSTEPVTIPELPAVCSLAAETGMCRGYFEAFHFNVTAGKCQKFVYGGCDGNDNRFDNETDCHRKCEIPVLLMSKETCLLQKETGLCDAFIPKFYYNSSTGRCEEFIYGGCGGNDNRFDSQEECQDRCNDTLPSMYQDICLFTSETGPCKAYMPRYFYNASSRICEEFIYGGCQGNDNRFETQTECQDRCKDTSLQIDICLLPSDTGPCKNYISSYFFNTTSRACETFIYGGCGGNTNRFDSELECQNNCDLQPNLVLP